MEQRLLATYLNDHLAGATAGRELARRAAAQNREGELGGFLASLARDIDEDREALRRLMRDLDIGEDRLKKAAGWSAEKAGRLKLNGRLWSYSPLSRVTELEGLTVGVRGKLALWRSLQAIRQTGSRKRGLRLPAWFDVTALIKRAEGQLEELERHRLAAVRTALSD